MKITYKPLIAAICLLCAGSWASAQNIEITDSRATVASNNIDIALTIKASELDFGTDGQLKLEFVVEGDGSRLILPEVIYTGKLRNLYERRDEQLSGQYIMPPYHIENKVKKDETYTLDYAVSIPYYPWMQHAVVSVNEYLHDCSGDYQVSSRVLVADMTPLRQMTKPTEWNPQPELYRQMVFFLVPQVEQVKKREATISLHLDYPVNVYKIIPEFGNNAKELQEADSLMQTIIGNELISVNGIEISGYASPDGPYNSNEQLSKNRAERVKQYLTERYKSVVGDAKITWTAEDWAGLRKMVADSNMPNQTEVLSIIDNERLSPDMKDRALQAVEPWSGVYKVILKEMYPKLRRIELSAKYTVMNVNDDQKAKELIYTNPGLLSLTEIYRVANMYEPDDVEYRNIYKIAAEQYPNDMIANNNAAAAFMMVGDTQSALPYLRKMEENLPASYLNLGTFYYISGDMEKANHFFRLAEQAGAKQADLNLQLLNK